MESQYGKNKMTGIYATKLTNIDRTRDLKVADCQD